MRFAEKQWMPLWVVAIFVVVPEAIVLPAILGDGSVGLLADVMPALVGLVLAAIFWLSIARRWIRVDDRALRIGDRKPIPLDHVTEARVVRGRELRRERRALLGQGPSTSAATGAIAATPVTGGGIANLVLGWSLLRRGRRGGTWGMLAQPWMREAVLVQVAGETKTPVLLLGTRRPDELLAALGGGRAPLAAPSAQPETASL